MIEAQVRSGLELVVGNESSRSTLERAREAVADAHRSLEEMRGDVLRLQQLSERLLDIGPPVLIVDSHRRVRGISAAAEQVLGTTAKRAVGRPLGTVLEDVDLSRLDEPQQIEQDGTSFAVRVLSAGPGDDADQLVLVEPA